MEVWDPVVAVATPSRLGEGPWWDADRGRLLWVDIPDGVIRTHAPATGSVGAHALGRPVGFVVGERSGGFVAGAADGLLALDGRLRTARLIGAPPDLDERRRINDGACDPAGRVLFGTVDPSGRVTGTLWSRPPDGSFRPLVEGVGMSNGVAFSPDGSRLYFVDTRAGRVDSFRYNTATGGISEREALISVPDRVGLPDGLAVDAEGCVWLAVWGAGEVWRVTPDGKRVGVVRMPVACPTSCAFGGSRGDGLYVTTARDDGDGVDGDRASGAIFLARVGIEGAPCGRAVLTGASRLDITSPDDRMKPSSH